MSVGLKKIIINKGLLDFSGALQRLWVNEADTRFTWRRFIVRTRMAHGWHWMMKKCTCSAFVLWVFSLWLSLVINTIETGFCCLHLLLAASYLTVSLQPAFHLNTLYAQLLTSSRYWFVCCSFLKADSQLLASWWRQQVCYLQIKLHIFVKSPDETRVNAVICISVYGAQTGSAWSL